jgi:hypothetical protein
MYKIRKTHTSQLKSNPKYLSRVETSQMQAPVAPAPHKASRVFTLGDDDGDDSDPVSAFIFGDPEKGPASGGEAEGEERSTKSLLITVLLAVFLGTFGLDWFYLGCGNTRYIVETRV